MANESDDVYDVDTMDDEELRDLIVRMMEDEPTLDAEAIDVEVRDGLVTVSGRLGTEQEVEAVEKIVVDRLGVDRFENELVVDELTRADTSEDAEEAAAEADAVSYERTQRGDRTEPSAEHLISDVEGDMYGTEDLQKAVEQGESYTPPDTPHEEGSRSRERH